MLKMNKDLVKNDIVDLNCINIFSPRSNDNFIQELNLKTDSLNNSFPGEEDDFSLDSKFQDQLYFIDKPENNVINENPSTHYNSLRINNKIWNRPIFYCENKIKQIFNKLKDEGNGEIFSEIISIFDENKNYINEVISELFKIKNQKPSLFLDENSEELFEQYKKNLSENPMLKIPKKRGRKNKNDSPGKHNRNSHDNIIKKIKANFFHKVIIFLNHILEPINETKGNLLKLSYEFIDKLTTDKEFNDLNSSLNDLASKEISKKYKTISNKKDFNRGLIKKILKTQKDPTILFAFNLSFRDWIALYCRKKTISQLIIEYGKNEQVIDSERIKKSLDNIGTFLYEIKNNNKNSPQFLIRFIFLLYNYEAWFYLRKARKKFNKKETNI